MSVQRHLRTRLVAGVVLAATLLTGLFVFSLGSAGARAVARTEVAIVPASRVVNVESPEAGLPDQTFQRVSLRPSLKASLITAANRGGTGNRSALVSAYIQGGGYIAFAMKEAGDDVVLALTQPIRLTRVSIRCDSFSAVPCRYTVSLVGN